jgi:hypothetical protein
MGWPDIHWLAWDKGGLVAAVLSLQITDYRLPIGPIKVGRPRGANLGSMGNNRRHTVIMR